MTERVALHRRQFLAAASAFVGAPALANAKPASAGTLLPAGPVHDEAWWARVAAQYDVTRDVIQLENGYWGMMPRPVLTAYQHAIERVNRDTSFYARRGMLADLAAVRRRFARFLGVEEGEIIFTRNATEALKALIGGYNRIRPGEAALYADLDYDSMQSALVASMARRGARAIRISLPEPASRSNVIAAYAEAFERHPEIRLVLLTHISHRTGLMIPVREIAAMARERGIDAIVDAAHSLGQVDYSLPALGADFAGFNLHKWIGAPLGVGAAYIRKDRAATIDPDIAEEHREPAAIDSRVHTGTVNYAALLTVPAALDFQDGIGGTAREARLRALRDRWAEAVRANPAVQVLTPADPGMHGAITSFRLRGKTSAADNAALAAALLDRHRIFTVVRTGLASGACVRVTPALFNTMQDMDALVRAVNALARAR